MTRMSADQTEGQIPSEIPWNLTDEATIDWLIEQGRTPILYRAIVGGNEGFVAHVPPYGIQEGDGAMQLSGGIIQFLAPDGTIRGIATTQIIDLHTGQAIIDKVNVPKAPQDHPQLQ